MYASEKWMMSPNEHNKNTYVFIKTLTIQSSLWLAYLPVLKYIHFHVIYIVNFYNAEHKVQGEKWLTKCCTTCKLINGGLGHAVGQHTRELEKENSVFQFLATCSGKYSMRPAAWYPQISVHWHWIHWRWSLWSWSGGAHRAESGGIQIWNVKRRGHTH